jgi:prepilin-type N-terminal cleavage/methylation domain-containing protein
MNVRTKHRRRTRRAFTMLELMVVVIVVGVLAAIATPIYAKYVQKSRFAEATSHMADILTAAKAYAMENDSDGDPSTVEWPSSCSAPGFIGDCSNTTYFVNYRIEATGSSSSLRITATGTGPMTSRSVTMIVDGLYSEGVYEVN